MAQVAQAALPAPHYSKFVINFVINMNIHFYLSDKGRETTSIVLVVSHRGKYYRKATGMTCKTAVWSAAKEKSGHAPTDKRLNEIRASTNSRHRRTSKKRLTRLLVSRSKRLPQKLREGTPQHSSSILRNGVRGKVPRNGRGYSRTTISAV